MTDSKKLNCIIVDDEPLACRLLADYVNKTPFLYLAGVYNNPLLALNDIKNNAVQLVFLDIHMPELSGLKFSALLHSDCKVIFTTAYPDHALKGYEINAVDYLLKPFTFERFLKAANKGLNICKSDEQLSRNNILPDYSGDQFLFVKTDYKIVKIVLAEMLFIEGLKEYIAIYMDNKKIITLQSMKKMEEVLPPNNFVRVHKSYIVAINKIDSVSKNRIFIRDKNIPIGEIYKESFFSKLNDKNLF